LEPSWSWMRAILGRVRMESEMDAELRFHIEALVQTRMKPRRVSYAPAWQSKQRHPDVLYEGHYRTVKKAACPQAKRAAVIDGADAGKDANLVRTAARYRIDTARIAGAVRAELTSVRSAKPRSSESSSKQAAGKTKTAAPGPARESNSRASAFLTGAALVAPPFLMLPDRMAFPSPQSASLHP
jgi:hypothetical protein